MSETTMTGRKDDQGKPPLSLISREFLEGLAQVLAFGAKKYAAHNWRGGMKWSRLADASMRHLLAWVDGEDKDPESGLSHLHHAAFGLMCLSTYQARGLGEDDRHKSAPTEERCQVVKEAIDRGMRELDKAKATTVDTRKPVGSRWVCSRTGLVYEIARYNENGGCHLRWSPGESNSHVGMLSFSQADLAQDKPA
jgi:hypothetical protein